MEERDFERLAADTFRAVLDLFDAVDPDDADVEPTGDVIRIDCRGGQRIVLNTQRPARQVWLAGGLRAFHFNYEAGSKTWVDDKGRGELFATLRTLVREACGLELPAT